jgi:precorrin-2 methylase
MQTTKTINLIGIGICDFKQITYEAAEQIQKSDIVFHLTLFDSQIKKLNLNTIDLTSKYISAQSPIVYQEFKNEIVDALATNNNVSVVNYGHPLYLVTTSQYIIDECNLHGYNVNFVPGVSSIDTIFCMLNKEGSM